MVAFLANQRQVRQIMVDYRADLRSRFQLESPSRDRGNRDMVEQSQGDSRNRGLLRGRSMSMTQTIIGVAVIGPALAVALNFVIPNVPPINVHSLSFDGAEVHQDRTVTTDTGTGVFWAQWNASVVSVKTGQPVEACTGSGSWNYKVGRKDVKMDLAKWTGNAACNLAALGRGQFFLQATWHWGDDQEQASSPIFWVP